MPEVDPLVLSYSHLANYPRAAEALHMLKKIASLVKPLMRARGWKVGELVEFYPDQKNLLGLNVDRGRRICLRLRYPGDRTLFLPVEEVADTMLHELAHNVHGPHNEQFHALWNKLRDEHLSLTLKGYTGEGFLSEGHRLGGGGGGGSSSSRPMPMDEARRIARAAAERRRTLLLSSSGGGGRRLGGSAPRPGEDIRKVIRDAAARRSRTLRGCANENQTQAEIVEIADAATRNGFRTQAEEDAANDAAIAQALWEMVQEEEEERAKANDTQAGGSYSLHNNNVAVRNGHDSIANRRNGSSSSSSAAAASRPPQASQHPPRQDRGSSGMWTCGICTLVNPPNYLCCDACGVERSEKPTSSTERTVIDLTKTDTPATHPRPSRSSSSSTASKEVNGKSNSGLTSQKNTPTRSVSETSAPPRTWTCHACGRIRESRWWSCDLCGTIKLSS
ncbi:WLM-domain-containing protein [Xylariaceae sp. FL0594]|nr:WLM-domain-containing protein [Xylariaceae sp. FL0594]